MFKKLVLASLLLQLRGNVVAGSGADRYALDPNGPDSSSFIFPLLIIVLLIAFFLFAFIKSSLAGDYTSQAQLNTKDSVNQNSIHQKNSALKADIDYKLTKLSLSEIKFSLESELKIKTIKKNNLLAESRGELYDEYENFYRSTKDYSHLIKQAEEDINRIKYQLTYVAELLSRKQLT